ncbi:uncharacterized protein [Oscarella lobularis]|uniref:uncharacterized protein isoform X2 n=1 Tax=Oscarella lobularis TaxID=121494 RepID=UPI0033143014
MRALAGRHELVKATTQFRNDASSRNYSTGTRYDDVPASTPRIPLVGVSKALDASQIYTGSDYSRSSLRRSNSIESIPSHVTVTRSRSNSSKDDFLLRETKLTSLSREKIDLGRDRGNTPTTEELTSSHRLVQHEDGEIAQIRNELGSAQRLLKGKNEEITEMREELASFHRLVERKDGEITLIRQELASVQREASLAQHRFEQQIFRKDQQISSIREELTGEVTSSHRLVQQKDDEMAQISEAYIAQRRLEQQKDEQISSIWQELASSQRLAQRKDEDIVHIREELFTSQRLVEQKNEEIAVFLMRYESLEASRDEIKGNLDAFTDVLNINSDEVHLSDKSLGSGSFAGVSVGRWREMRVAVKKIHELIISQRNEAMFKREVVVCSRLHHPNIMVVCGAVMTEGAPLQIVMELLEGSVSEVIDAAHASRSYLTIYEQLSIAMDMTSGIAYLHQIRPRPYVHGDIRPSNVLVTRDMKVKIGDLGAAHIIESSLSAGPMSPPYLAPERAPLSGGTATSSTLSSDVYSMGVSLLEIFTGVGPIPEERHTQLGLLANRSNLFVLCSRLISRDPAKRLSAQTCFETLKIYFGQHEKHLSELELVTAKRLVNGVFEKDTHKVILLNISLN